MVLHNPHSLNLILADGLNLSGQVYSEIPSLKDLGTDSNVLKLRLRNDNL